MICKKQLHCGTAQRDGPRRHDQRDAHLFKIR